MSEVYLSRDGYAKLKEELKELKETERPTYARLCSALVNLAIYLKMLNMRPLKSA